MSGVNKAIIIGNIGNIELKETQAGDQIAKISVATSEKYKNRNGEQVENTEWHNVTFFGKLAEIVAQYASKGMKVYVEGKMKTTKKENADGTNQYFFGIVGGSFQMLSSKQDGNNGNWEQGKSYGGSDSGAGSKLKTPENYTPPESFPSVSDDFDDTIPF